MKIDGKILAQDVLRKLKDRLDTLPVKPTLAIIQVGYNQDSTSYIRQKRKKAEEVGINLVHKHFPETISENQIITEIRQLNNDAHIQGIIIQRPLPKHITSETVASYVSNEKDVDGYRTDSSFIPPVSQAVLYVLTIILKNESKLRTKNIVIIGKGETAGSPIASTFTKKGIPFTTIDTKTQNREQLLKKADIIISCAGKRDVFRKKDIQKGVIVIGVGINREKESLEGDYNENEIKHIASYYTPTPGGIGPLTVAFLLSNCLL